MSAQPKREGADGTAVTEEKDPLFEAIELLMECRDWIDELDVANPQRSEVCVRIEAFVTKQLIAALGEERYRELTRSGVDRFCDWLPANRGPFETAKVHADMTNVPGAPSAPLESLERVRTHLRTADAVDVIQASPPPIVPPYAAQLVESEPCEECGTHPNNSHWPHCSHAERKKTPKP